MQSTNTDPNAREYMVQSKGSEQNIDLIFSNLNEMLSKIGDMVQEYERMDGDWWADHLIDFGGEVASSAILAGLLGAFSKSVKQVGDSIIKTGRMKQTGVLSKDIDIYLNKLSKSDQNINKWLKEIEAKSSLYEPNFQKIGSQITVDMENTAFMNEKYPDLFKYDVKVKKGEGKPDVIDTKFRTKPELVKSYATDDFVQKLQMQEKPWDRINQIEELLKTDYKRPFEEQAYRWKLNQPVFEDGVARFPFREAESVKYKDYLKHYSGENKTGIPKSYFDRTVNKNIVPVADKYVELTLPMEEAIQKDVGNVLHGWKLDVLNEGNDQAVQEMVNAIDKIKQLQPKTAEELQKLITSKSSTITRADVQKELESSIEKRKKDITLLDKEKYTAEDQAVIDELVISGNKDLTKLNENLQKLDEKHVKLLNEHGDRFLDGGEEYLQYKVDLLNKSKNQILNEGNFNTGAALRDMKQNIPDQIKNIELKLEDIDVIRKMRKMGLDRDNVQILVQQYADDINKLMSKEGKQLTQFDIKAPGFYQNLQTLKLKSGQEIKPFKDYTGMQTPTMLKKSIEQDLNSLPEELMNDPLIAEIRTAMNQNPNIDRFIPGEVSLSDAYDVIRNKAMMRENIKQPLYKLSADGSEAFRDFQAMRQIDDLGKVDPLSVNLSKEFKQRFGSKYENIINTTKENVEKLPSKNIRYINHKDIKKFMKDFNIPASVFKDIMSMFI